jgi:hypothetical protein
MANKVRNYYGVYENEIHDYKYYKIIMLEKTFEKTASGKSWKKNPANVEEKEIKFEEYFNYLSSIEFFKNLGGYERVEKTYTYKGYIPTKLTSISPDKNIKIVRSFKIEKKED